jgi:hypothetical protein
MERKEEGKEGHLHRAHLVPSCEQFRVRISKKAPDIGATEGKSGKGDREEEWNGGARMFPAGRIVARPDGTELLRTREKRTRQDERTVVLPFVPPHEAIRCSLVHVVTVEIVPLAMFHTCGAQAAHEQDERTNLRLFSPLLSSPGMWILCCTFKVFGVFAHRDFRTVEDTWLVHVVPCVQDFRGTHIPIGPNKIECEPTNQPTNPSQMYEERDRNVT